MYKNKFRVWDKKNRILIDEGSDFLVDQNGLLWHSTDFDGTKDGGSYTEKGLYLEGQDQFIVLWCVGKRDKNRKEIYDGDKLKINLPVGDAVYGSVKREDFAWEISGIGWLYNFASKDLEVAGNIYEEK